MVSVYVDEDPYPSHNVVDEDEDDPGDDCAQIIAGHPEKRIMSVSKRDLAIITQRGWLISRAL